MRNVYVSGEISNYKTYASGHSYFTLKDANGSIRCTLFRSYAARLRFQPRDGMKVIAMGRVSLYAADGAYQLNCEAMNPDGVGDLHVAFEQLKEKLWKEGLFSESHKKPLPRFPKTVAIITSASGAAVHDMIRILGQRYPLAEVKLLPAVVQGEEAPPSLIRALEYANRYRVADVIIIGRGGGSIEDLWAFNDERLARTIYASEIPVISAVGHEPDVTIADFVADKRASTPSNAAEIAVPDRAELLESLQAMRLRMVSSEQQRLKLLRQRLDEQSRKRVLTDPLATVHDKRQLLDHKQKELYNAARALLTAPRQRLSVRKGALEAAVRTRLEAPKRKLAAGAAALHAMSPLKVLGRGFALVTGAEGKPLRKVAEVPVGSQITARLSDGKLRCRVEETIQTKEKIL